MSTLDKPLPLGADVFYGQPLICFQFIIIVGFLMLRNIETQIFSTRWNTIVIITNKMFVAYQKMQ